MKQSVRSFSIGLFTAGIIILIGLYFFDDPVKEAEGTAVEEMIPLVEKDGYRVITEEEYISLSVNKDNNKAENETIEENTTTEETEPEVSDEESNQAEENTKEEDTSTEEANSSEEETEKQNDVVTYTLNIQPGMASSAISSSLKENKIIKDSEEFNQYLQDQDYSLKVQIGNYKLSSDMSFYEIAEAITN